jgi:hypothetical protein
MKLKPRIELLTEEDYKQFIAVNTEVVVVAPWNGAEIPVTIRILDSVAVTSCGDFNEITAIAGEAIKDITIEDMVATKNIHENLLRLALVHPTFEFFEQELMAKDFYNDTKKIIEHIKELIPKLVSEVEKQRYTEQLERYELALAFLIPEDFTSYIVAILLQQQATDINKLTKDILLKVGFLAERYNKRPSEFLQGTFTEKQNVDIDVTALTIVSEYREMQKTEKNGMKWIRGKGK